jgi:two-component system, cell cycle response regulator DivK
MTSVLYIEDNEDNIFMLQSRLERKGYQVTIAKDGYAGYDAAVTNVPDIILLDVGLPEMDGYDTARKLKANEITKAIPIIMLTAHALSDDRDKAFAAGADEYEAKPVNFAVLLEKITKLTSS